MFIVDFLVTGGASMAVQLLPDTVGRQQWRRASTAQVRRLLRLSSLLLRPRLGGGVADLCFSNFRLYSGARVVSNLQTREQDKACPLYLGFWGSGPAAWQADSSCVLPHHHAGQQQEAQQQHKAVLGESFPVFSIPRSAASAVRKVSSGIIENIRRNSVTTGLFPGSNKLIVRQQCPLSPVWFI